MAAPPVADRSPPPPAPAGASTVRLSVSAGRHTVRIQAFACEALRYRGSAQDVLKRGRTGTATIELEEVITGVLSSENSLISSGLSSEFNTDLLADRTATLEGATWSIEVSDTVDLTSLVPTFTLSGGATARVGGIEQESGGSTVDFSSLSVDYVITSRTAAPRRRTRWR